MSNASAATRPNREAFLQRLEAQNNNHNINNNHNNNNNKTNDQQQDEDDILLRADPAKLEAAKSSMKAYLRKHGVEDLDPASLDYLLRMDQLTIRPIRDPSAKKTLTTSSHVEIKALNNDTNWNIRDANHGDNLQMALLDLLERQTKALMRLQVEVETLRKQQQEQLNAASNSIHEQQTNSNDSNSNSNSNQGANDHAENPNPEQRQGVIATLWERIKNLIRNEIRQFGLIFQQIRDHPNLDLNLLIKLVMLVAVFGGRAIAKSQARGKDVQEAYQRVTILAIVAFGVYLYKTGLYLQIVHWIKDILQNRGAVPVNMMLFNNGNNNNLNNEGNANANANERRGQRQRAADDSQQETEHSNQHSNQARPPRRFWSDGVVEPDGVGGFGMDVVYFVVGYVCSLLPTWKPEIAVVDGGTQPDLDGVEETTALAAADGFNANDAPVGDGVAVEDGVFGDDSPRDERQHNEAMEQEEQEGEGEEEESVIDNNDSMPRDDGNDVAPNVD
eukprot:CAMPEP_0116025412 /NCGR_PEP_ID=MMETSP0321-20121206/13031_1 /TAXON_ID=163516 /ORGANISM="Leptocylindrus danicus var. danicus, Strain B650" /LENGTH=502 /DNA_ID=CAMNT_0003497597 /DNA_START=17 /DNA_END=1525 /DNA_ORIENTATION=+